MSTVTDDSGDINRLRHKYANKAGLASDVERDITESYNALQDSIPEGACRLKEYAFIDVYLPMMLRNDPDWHSRWLEIAGSPRLPVVLVDSRDEMVNVVPPLFSTVDTGSTKGLDLHEAGSFLAMTRENGRAWQGSEVMTEAMIKADSQIKIESNLDKWVTLIKSYTNPSTKDNSTTESQEDDFEDYDF